MERDALVRRESDPMDGRTVWLQATAKGARTLHQGRRRRVAALADEINKLSETDRETLASAADILERLLRPASNQESSERTRVAGKRR
jgi:DNA-binding MarR family transcriptional regulator